MSRPIYNDGTWPWACEQLLSGARLRRKGWVQGATIGIAEEDGKECCVFVHKDGVKNHQVRLCAEQIKAMDWEVTS